jgi:hypothetical protein
LNTGASNLLVVDVERARDSDERQR